MATATPYPEIPESDAPPPIKAIYDDIKATLRVPLVNLVFRVLAANPDFLEIAWQQLRPNARTVFFERRADDIRLAAVTGMLAMGRPPACEDPEIRDVLKVFHYVNPKLLLAVAALRSATVGQLPRLEQLSRDEKRQIVPGIPSGVPEIDLSPGQSEPEAVETIFSEIKSTYRIPVVNSDYRALARWPEYFGEGWSALRAAAQDGAYRRLERSLRGMAAEAVLVMPFRVEINPHVMRLVGLTEGDIDRTQSTLELFYRLLAPLVMNIAYLAAGALGAEEAARSPYPPDIL